MNTVNYPYLAGYLESALKNLAIDRKFLSLKTDEAREDYVRAAIADANASAKKYAAAISE